MSDLMIFESKGNPAPAQFGLRAQEVLTVHLERQMAHDGAVAPFRRGVRALRRGGEERDAGFPRVHHSGHTTPDCLMAPLEAQNIAVLGDGMIEVLHGQRHMIDLPDVNHDLQPVINK
jgi:hypothetical protein